MDSWYLRVVTEEYAQEILALFTPDGTRRCKLMPMGDLNSDPTCVAMMMNLQTEWGTLAKDCTLKNVTSKIIVDDVLLHGRTENQLLAYFRKVPEVQITTPLL